MSAPDEVVIDGVVYQKKPIIPKCGNCGDKGWYRFWNGRGEVGDFYCSKCDAGPALNKADLIARDAARAVVAVEQEKK